MIPQAELVVRGARVWTDGSLQGGEDAIAVAAGRVLARGTAADLAALVGARTRVLDAVGGTLTPGLCDAHVHLVQWARSLGEVPLADCASWAAVVERVGRGLAEHPERDVVVGRGWDANGWSAPPDRAALDRVSPGRAVVLHSKDFHAVWVNGAALARCGIGRDTPDPAGGRIVRDAAGEATGLLMENAVRLCTALLGAETADAASRDATGVRDAVRRLHALGVTAIHDFEGPVAHRLLRESIGSDGPGLRVVMHLAREGLEPALALGLTSGTGDDSFRIGAVKLFADGTLGSRTAAMLSPYEGTPERGMELLSPAELRELVGRAFAGGLSVAVHAIGDRAVRNALDAFEAARDGMGRLRLPPRIEHLQLVHPDDLGRLAALGVGASMQPSHATADARLAERHWGARIETAYPWASLRDRGATLAFGSDAPVEAPDPAEGLHAAVTRAVPGEARSFVPAQRLGLDAALSAYTEGAARLGGGWPRLGTLRPGSHADFVVWRDDLHALEPARLRQARPAWTAVAGRLVCEPGVAGAVPVTVAGGAR